MSIALYHASLGRFSDHSASEDENDSTLHYIQRERRRQEADDESTRDSILRGRPGSRRFRRHLNSVLSDYDSEYTDTEVDDEDIPVVTFEWDETFIKAGTYFFDEQGHQAQVVKNTDLSQKRTEHRNRLKQRYIARQQRLKQARAQNKNANDSGIEQKEQETVDGDDGSVIPGQEIAPHLWRDIDKNMRYALRHVSHTDLLDELEPLLVAYKNNQLNALTLHKQKFATFDVLPLPSHVQKKVLEQQSKGDAQASATAPLAIVFKDSFARIVCHACSTFHQLVSHSADAKNNAARVTIIRQHRDGVFLQHTASFSQHLQNLYNTRQARKNNTGRDGNSPTRQPAQARRSKPSRRAHMNSAGGNEDEE